MKNKLKTLKKNEIKAKIANGIWKFRTKFWNDTHPLVKELRDLKREKNLS